MNDARNTKQNVTSTASEFDRIRCRLPIVYIAGIYRRITGHIITGKSGYFTNPFSIVLARERTVFMSYSIVNDTVTSHVLIDLGTGTAASLPMGFTISIEDVCSKLSRIRSIRSFEALLLIFFYFIFKKFEKELYPTIDQVTGEGRV